MEKRYYSLDEALHYLEIAGFKGLSRRDLNDAALRKLVRFCYWFNDMVAVFEDDFMDVQRRSQIDSMTGYCQVPAWAISPTTDVFRFTPVLVVEELSESDFRGITLKKPNFLGQVEFGPDGVGENPISLKVPASEVVIPQEDLFALIKVKSADASEMSKRTDTALHNIIGALCQLYYEAKYPPGEKLVQARIIDALVPAYEDYYGISERNLKTHLPIALKAVNFK